MGRVAAKTLFCVLALWLALYALVGLYDFNEVVSMIKSGRAGQMGVCYASVTGYVIANLLTPAAVVSAMAFIIYRRFELSLVTSILLLVALILTSVFIPAVVC